MQTSEKFINKGFLIFKCGTFLLLTAPAIASFLYLLSLLISSISNKKNYFNDKWNYPFLISGTLILLIALLSNTYFLNDLKNWDQNLNLIGLIHWVPYFYCIWSFQPYLKTKNLREKISIILLSSTVPFIFSAIGQKFFNWYGPMSFFNGLITWYQRPLGTGERAGITGIFNNQNYAAAWLLIVFPFCIASIKKSKVSKLKNFMSYLITTLIIFIIYLTNSRGAWLGSIFSVIFLTAFKVKIFLIVPIFIIASLLIINNFTFIPEKISLLIEKVIPVSIYHKFALNTGLINLENYPRLYIWKQAIGFISERPLLGWGAASFAFLLKDKGSKLIFDHSHNLPLELALSYGIFISLLINLTIIFIIYKSFKIIFKEQKFEKDIKFDQAWWTSSFVLYSSQLFDIQYFDIRISLVFWILISGLICIIKENDK